MNWKFFLHVVYSDYSDLNSIAGDKQLNRERVENASQTTAVEVFFIPKINWRG